MNRIDRLFGILTLLQSRRFVTAEKISEKFGISIRTVYRDVKALGEQGIPVSFEPNKGYFIVPGYFLPPVSFTTHEASAMLLIESIIYAFSDKSVQENYTSALNKVKAVMNTSQKEKLEALASTIRSQYPDCIKHDYDYLTVVQNAITEKHCLKISYQNNNGENSERLIEPIGLVYYAFNWHLIAWCHKRSDYRDFKVVRIKQMHNTGTGFQKRNHLSINEYMKMLPVSY